MSKPAAPPIPAALTDPRARILITPEGLALPLTLASRAARAGALVIDLMILVIGFVIFNLVMVWIFTGLLDGTPL